MLRRDLIGHMTYILNAQKKGINELNLGAQKNALSFENRKGVNIQKRLYH